jgi:hypothetical protein
MGVQCLISPYGVSWCLPGLWELSLKKWWWLNAYKRVTTEVPSLLQRRFLRKLGREEGERRNESDRLRPSQDACLSTGPLPALTVRSPGRFELQINWGVMSPWEQPERTKWEIELLFIAHALILCAGFIRCIIPGLRWEQGYKSHGCLSSQKNIFILFPTHPKVSNTNSEL